MDTGDIHESDLFPSNGRYTYTMSLDLAVSVSYRVVWRIGGQRRERNTRS